MCRKGRSWVSRENAKIIEMVARDRDVFRMKYVELKGQGIGKILQGF